MGLLNEREERRLLNKLDAQITGKHSEAGVQGAG